MSKSDNDRAQVPDIFSNFAGAVRHVPPMRFALHKLGFELQIDEDDASESICTLQTDFSQEPWAEAKIESFSDGLWFIHPRRAFQGFGFFSDKRTADHLANRMKLRSCRLDVVQLDRKHLDYFEPMWSSFDAMAEAFWSSPLADTHRSDFSHCEAVKGELLNKRNPLFGVSRYRVDPKQHPYS